MKLPLTKFILGCAVVTLAAAGSAQEFTAFLDGPSESPPNASPGTGFADVTINTTLVTMRVQVNFSGLTAGVTASHIHAATTTPFTGTAGVATQTPTFSGFPSGVTSGSYDNTFDMTQTSSYNSSYITANGGTALSAFNALLNAMQQGRSYLNIHTSNFPGGEIRGFLTPVPEPGTILSLGALFALSVVGARRRSRRF